MDSELTHAFTEAQVAAIQSQLWELLQRQVQRYTMGESGSIPVETAEELLRGLSYLLREGVRSVANGQGMLLEGALDQLVQQGLEQVEQQVQEALRRYQFVCAHPPVVTNRAYRDTIGNILSFFLAYDPRFFPHMIPCAIDYQLFLPVSEGLSGVGYLNQYLTHLAVENQVLSCFDRETAQGVLHAACVDAEDLLINLYEPVFQNALGRCLLRRDVSVLSITPGEREQLHEQLSPLSLAALGNTVEQGALELADLLRMPELAAYLRRSAWELLPRLQVALEHHSLEGVFVTG